MRRRIIRFDIRKGIAGIILGILSLAVCALYQEWNMGILFAILFIVAGSIKLDIKNPQLRFLLYIIWIFAIAAVTWLAPIVMINPIYQVTVTFGKILLNFLCIFVVCGAVYIITAKPILSAAVGTFLLLVLATVNGFIYEFRGKELSYIDILSLRTALNVAGQYKISFSLEIIYVWITWLLIIFVGFSLSRMPKLPKNSSRERVFAVGIILVVVLVFASASMPIKSWADEGTRMNGYYLNFYFGIRDSVVKKPKNYNVKDIERLGQKYITSDSISRDSLPNVIVIMDESYADFRILGNLRTNRPVTPFLDSLTKNTVRGYALTSVYAGNTANTEFEFLTGHSMMFLPENSVPYQQYINGETQTLAHLMSSYGYKSVSTHPCFANGWSRNIIYPYFGFDESTFIEAYSTKHPVGNYVSDRDMFGYVIESLENNDDPLFLFGITMQNHGGYDNGCDDFEDAIELLGYSKEYPMAKRYLNLIHETDSAMEYLLTTLENFSEDTVVLFFGDHFPGIESEFYEELYGGAFDTLSKQRLQYTVPFVIWANYDMPDKNIECTSINYLSGHLMEAAGLPLSPYQRFLSDVEKVIPAMNAQGYFSVSQNKFISRDEAVGDNLTWLNQYGSLLYNQLFDPKNRNEIFFGEQLN